MKHDVNTTDCTKLSLLCKVCPPLVISLGGVTEGLSKRNRRQRSSRDKMCVLGMPDELITSPQVILGIHASFH